MRTTIVTLFLGLMIPMLLPAQSDLSWRDHRNLAEEAAERGNYAEAAEHYASAYQLKTKREELAYQAAENYYLLRDYRKAAEYYQPVKGMYYDYPLAGLKYARSLKQDGQYEQAIEAFRTFGNGYTGQGKAILEEVIRIEIRGCELGMALPAQAPRNVELFFPSGGVNSDAQEFAPLPFSEGVLYFSSNRGERARIYRSEKQGDRWSRANLPENFPIIQQNHYCHGSLAPDGTRFYFTMCGADQEWRNFQNRCEIFVIKRQGGSWSQPERLPDNINVSGKTATHPFVTHVGVQEVLYFVSDRDGGRGGKDIWYATRNLGSDNLNFSSPVNLGATINTLGDEITPHYDQNSGILYFSSTGHISAGGYDIFSSRGETTSWSVPENMGFPYNSSADDYFYVNKTQSSGGFFASNRIYGGQKISTRHDDIFEWRGVEKPVTLRGNVYNISTNELVDDFNILVYKMNPGGGQTLLFSEQQDNGTYSFEIDRNQEYLVQINSEGYEQASYKLTTDDPYAEIYGQPVFMEEAEAEPSPGEEVITPPRQPEVEEPGAPVSESGEILRPPAEPEDEGGSAPLLEGTETGMEYTTRATSPADQYEYVSRAPRYQGEYFRVQLIALSRINLNAGRFDSLRDLGPLYKEYIIRRDLTRALLGDYFSKSEAFQAAEEVRSRGFSGAFVVKYEDGQRYGRVNQ